MGKKSPKSVNPNPDEFMREMERVHLVFEDGRELYATVKQAGK